jgi:hypothetical protein
MRNRLSWRVALLGVLVSLMAVAADVSGKWKAEFTTPDGTQRVNLFTFKVDDGKLTGTDRISTVRLRPGVQYIARKRVGPLLTGGCADFFGSPNNFENPPDC